MKRPLKTTELKRIRELAADGLTTRQIAETIGGNYEAVCKLQCRYGIKTGRSNRLWTEEEDKIIRFDAACGVTAARTALVLGRTEDTVRHRRMILGVQFKPSRPLLDATEFKRMWDDGISREQIAFHFGRTSVRWVYNQSRKLGLERRKSGRRKKWQASIK